MIAALTAAVLVTAIRIIAGVNIPVLSIIFRTWWNISFKIVSYIPFCGWMAHFIITEGDDTTEKERYINIGKNADKVAADMLKNAAEKAANEQKAYKAKRDAEEAKRKETEEELREKAYRKYGRRDVTVSQDSSKAKIGDSDYVSTEELRKFLN